MAEASPFYARIKRDTLAIVQCIPEGRLVTYKSIGGHLDVVPRHIAYILASLEPSEYARFPWFRVVLDQGLLGKEKVNDLGINQRELLALEGVIILPSGAIANFDELEVAVEQLNSGIPKQTRPANAPRR
jgi:methylated-DNA-protein-cysteine methyltransferase related protein